MELTEKQLSKLKDLHRMQYHLYYWAYEVLSKADITTKEYEMLAQISDMNHIQQQNTYIVNGEITELPKNPEYYRKVKKHSRDVGVWQKRANLHRKDK